MNTTTTDGNFHLAAYNCRDARRPETPGPRYEVARLLAFFRLSTKQGYAMLSQLTPDEFETQFHAVVAWFEGNHGGYLGRDFEDELRERWVRGIQEQL